MSLKRVCVFGCDRFEGVYIHRFPHPEKRSELFSTWMSVMGDKLKQKDAMRIFSSHRVCDFHFKPEDKTTGHRLAYLAVPSLYLKGFFKSMNTSIPIQMEHNYCVPRMSAPGGSVMQDKSITEGVSKLESDITEIDNDIQEAWLRSPDACPDIIELSMDDDVKDNFSLNDDIKHESKTDPDTRKHEGYTCNECNGSISGFRYTCVQCPDYDLCAACEAGRAHAGHYALRVPGPRPYAEINSVLDSIRLNLIGLVSPAIPEYTAPGLLDDLLDDIKIEFVEDDDFSGLAEMDMPTEEPPTPSFVPLRPEVENYKILKMQEDDVPSLPKLRKKPFKQKDRERTTKKYISMIVDSTPTTDPLHITAEELMSNYVTKNVAVTSLTKPTAVYLGKHVKRKSNNLVLNVR